MFINCMGAAGLICLFTICGICMVVEAGHVREKHEAERTALIQSCVDDDGQWVDNRCFRPGASPSP